MLFMQKSKKMEEPQKEQDQFDSLEFGLSILKKILESKPWDSINPKSNQADGKKDEQNENDEEIKAAWEHLQKGLMIFFVNFKDQDQSVSEFFMKYLPEKIQDKMAAGCKPFKDFLDQKKLSEKEPKIDTNQDEKMEEQSEPKEQNEKIQTI